MAAGSNTALHRAGSVLKGAVYLINLSDDPFDVFISHVLYMHNGRWKADFLDWIYTAMSENLYIIPGGIGAGRYVVRLLFRISVL